MDEYIEITMDEAKELYCNGENVFISNNQRQFWRLPPSYMYGSRAPEEVLFRQSIPYGEGETTFFRAR